MDFTSLQKILGSSARILVLSLILFLSPAALSGQPADSTRAGFSLRGVKTNLLWDASATVNLGVEFRTGGRTSLDVSGNWNTWTFPQNRKWKHYLVQPELRRWTGEVFRGSFFGLHGHYGVYNISRLPSPPFPEYMTVNRFEGWLAGAGVSYGYRWNFDRRLALEATIGAGYAYLSYERLPCGNCGERLGRSSRHYFGPTKAGVTLIYGIGGKRAPGPRPLPVYVGPVAAIREPGASPAPRYEPEFRAGFVVPEAETAKNRSETVVAFLGFAQGGSDIVPGFRNNAAELQKVRTLIGSVESDPDATITGITITGYASPEGTWADNRELSRRRTQSMKDYISSIRGAGTEVSVRAVGEDWTTLDTLVVRSDMAERSRILEIIRGTDVFEGRERKLMALADGGPYLRMKAELFPGLRRVECRIDYTAAPFTVEKGREVLRTRPGNLSLNEMFLIANTYEPGSDAFNEVFETAARVYPDSDAANVNAAASALGRGDAAAAARYLDRVKEHTAAWWNNTGLLAWLRGDKAEAAGCFAKGGEQGAANGAELEKHLNPINASGRRAESEP